MAKEGNKNMMIDVTWKLPKRSEVREAMVRFYLTSIPRARMGYLLRGHESERNNCFSKIQLVGQKYGK